MSIIKGKESVKSTLLTFLVTNLTNNHYNGQGFKSGLFMGGGGGGGGGG